MRLNSRSRMQPPIMLSAARAPVIEGSTTDLSQGPIILPLDGDDNVPR